MRDGDTLTHLVEFTTGFPDGDIVWSILDAANTPVAGGLVTPVDGATHALITVLDSDNSLSDDEVVGPRELRWNYLVNGEAVTGYFRYRLEGFLPFGVSPEGVRRKLGLEPHELSDDDINLISAYGAFRSRVGATALAGLQTSDGYTQMVLADAIEAYAALRLLATLPVRITKKEASGTDQFERAAVDWDALRAQLEQMVSDGQLIVDPTSDGMLSYGAIFVAVVRGDPVVGEAT